MQVAADDDDAVLIERSEYDDDDVLIERSEYDDDDVLIKWSACDDDNVLIKRSEYDDDDAVRELKYDDGADHNVTDQDMMMLLIEMLKILLLIEISKCWRCC